MPARPPGCARRPPAATPTPPPVIFHHEATVPSRRYTESMPAGLLLTIAIVSEVAATLALRMSHGFTRPLPVLIVVAGYATSFWFMAQVLKHLPVGLTYAVWSAVGTALIATFGIVAWGESATMLKLASLGLIIMGVVGLNLASPSPLPPATVGTVLARPPPRPPAATARSR